MGNIFEAENKINDSENMKKLENVFKYHSNLNDYKDFIEKHFEQYLNNFDIFSKLYNAFDQGYFGIHVKINCPVFVEYFEIDKTRLRHIVAEKIKLLGLNGNKIYLSTGVGYFKIGSKIQNDAVKNDPRFQKHILESFQFVSEFETEVVIEKQIGKNQKEIPLVEKELR